MSFLLYYSECLSGLKAKKIKDIAKVEPEIKEKWERAKQNKHFIENIFREIKKKASKR